MKGAILEKVRHFGKNLKFKCNGCVFESAMESVKVSGSDIHIYWGEVKILVQTIVFFLSQLFYVCVNLSSNEKFIRNESYQKLKPALECKVRHGKRKEKVSAV